MKLQHNSPKINTGFKKSPRSRYSRYLQHSQSSALAAGESDLIGYSHHPSNNHYLHTDSADAKVELYDRFGRVFPHSFSTSIITVINDNSLELKEFCLFLADSLYKAGKTARIINADLFISHTHKKDPEVHYIVQGSYSTFQGNSAPVLRVSGAVCMFGNQESRLVCGLRGYTSMDMRTGKIINALGGDTQLRSLMLASLEVGEFMLVSGDSETVRQFKNQQSIEGDK